MRELTVRSISGLVYVVLLLTCVFYSQVSFQIFFFILGCICIYEFQKLIHFKNYFIYLLYFALFLLYRFVDVPYYITIALLACTLTTQLFLVKDLIIIRIIPMFEKKKYIVSIFFLVNALIFLTLIPQVVMRQKYEPLLMAGAFGLIWTNDSFAFLIGKNFGKRKLLKRISPKKTIEGMLGGIVFGLLASCLFYYYTGLLSLPVWLCISLIMSIFGTLGDLIQSKFKRQAGVKDSGTIMPGHGGIFDRLDSVIFAAPFLYTFLYILSYVS